MQWVKIRSWHAVRPSRALEPRTLCGRIAPAGSDTVDDLPTAKSCETCLRLYAREQDRNG